MEAENKLKNYIQSSIDVKHQILNDTSFMLQLNKVCELCVETFNNGNKILLGGNGGSAADAQHIAAEFVSRFRFDRPALPSISLSTDTSMLTAIGNDYGFSKLFSRQLEANGQAGDIFIGITTSGKSENVIEAVEYCKKVGITSVVFTGKDDCKLSSITDFYLPVPSNQTSLIQESHIMIGHIICGYVEDVLFGEK
jgi:D-sedoheptulose 7-phosphate isomerase